VARPQFVDTGTGALFAVGERKLVPIAISDIGAHAQGLSPGTGHTHRLNTKNMA
jgi:hypothetical protein